MVFNYDEYLCVDKIFILWCWGCGDGVILKFIICMIDVLGWKMDDVCLVSGIGCSGRMSLYVNCNIVYIMYGRVVVYVIGIKMVNFSKYVIVVFGDGDGFVIGGNYIMYVCRRNIDLNFILVNNFIYGLINF